MANPFDQFDQPTQKSGGNPFDQFDAAPEPRQRKPIGAPQELSIGEKIVSALPKGITDWLSNPTVMGENIGAGSRAHGAAMGAADPVVGAVQLVANIPGISDAISSTPGLSDLITGDTKAKNPVNQAIDAKNAEYERARSGQGRDGVDVARIVGNIASPANVAVSAVAPINAVSTLGKVAQGIRAGAIGGSMAPVENADESFLAEKALQTGAGAVTGGVLTPIAAKAGEAITRRVAGLSPADAATQADKIMVEGVNRLQRDGVQLSVGDTKQLRQQVLQSLQQGQKIDPAAMFRKADFEALGMQPTLGQITRDGAQFSREKNLRGVAGIGDPLLSRLDQQSRRLQELVTSRSAGAADESIAGQQMMQSLKGVDDQMRAGVTDLYAAARSSAGKDIDIPLNGLAQDYANTLSSFGDKVPSGVRNQFEALGLTKGTQQKVFNFEEADKLLKVINDNVTTDPAVNKALGELRGAVKRAATAVDSTGGPFAPAVAAAKKRFETHDAAPALRAAVEGDTSAQDFVRRFLINGKVEDVSGLAKIMPEEAKQEARKQFGAAIERAAFGQNMTGDKAIAQESLAKFLNQSGMKQKMSAFFSPDEMSQFDRISRVAAYTTSFPANNTVNTSNTGVANFALGLLSKIPGVPGGVGLLNSAKNAAGNYTAVNSALKANPAQSAADIPPKQLELLRRILGGGMAGVAGAAGTGIGD